MEYEQKEVLLKHNMLVGINIFFHDASVAYERRSLVD